MSGFIKERKRVYYLDGANKYTAITGGYIPVCSKGYAGKESNIGLELYTIGPNSRDGSYYTKNKINFDNIDKIYFDVDCNSDSSSTYFYFGLSDNNTSAYDDFAYKVAKTGRYSGILELNCTNIKGDYYVKMHGGSYADTHIYIKKIYADGTYYNTSDNQPPKSGAIYAYANGQNKLIDKPSADKLKGVKEIKALIDGIWHTLWTAQLDLIQNGKVVNGSFENVEQSPGEFFYDGSKGCIVFTGWCKFFQQTALDFTGYTKLVIDIETQPDDWWGLDVAVGNKEKVPYWINLPDTNPTYDLSNQKFKIQERKKYVFNLIGHNKANGRVYLQRDGDSHRFFLYNMWLE